MVHRSFQVNGSQIARPIQLQYRYMLKSHNKFEFQTPEPPTKQDRGCQEEHHQRKSH